MRLSSACCKLTYIPNVNICLIGSDLSRGVVVVVRRLYSFQLEAERLASSVTFCTHLFLNSPMYTCNANNANTIKQKIVRVITSANCLNECNNALMIVFKPETKQIKTFRIE